MFLWTGDNSSVFILSTEDNTTRPSYLDHRMDGLRYMLPARKDMTELFTFSSVGQVWSRRQRWGGSISQEWVCWGGTL